MQVLNGFHNKIADVLSEHSLLDKWTATHMALGAFICKIALWLGCSDLWAVLWVVILGIAWEVYEYIVEGTHEVYGTTQKWFNNTMSDLVVEIGIAVWMVI